MHYVTKLAIFELQYIQYLTLLCKRIGRLCKLLLTDWSLRNLYPILTNTFLTPEYRLPKEGIHTSPSNVMWIELLLDFLLKPISLLGMYKRKCMCHAGPRRFRLSWKNIEDERRGATTNGILFQLSLLKLLVQLSCSSDYHHSRQQFCLHKQSIGQRMCLAATA